MENAVTERAPMHLWIVGGLGALWNACGCYDYVMTRMRDTDYLASMMPTSSASATRPSPPRRCREPREIR